MAETIESAQRTIMVADSSKCGRSAFAHIGRLDAVQVLITDSAPAGTGLYLGGDYLHGHSRAGGARGPGR
jgi:DeoR/GlpR family transcriptional regulator of sugar metabolism